MVHLNSFKQLVSSVSVCKRASAGPVHLPTLQGGCTGAVDATCSKGMTSTKSRSAARFKGYVRPTGSSRGFLGEGS